MSDFDKVTIMPTPDPGSIAVIVRPYFHRWSAPSAEEAKRAAEKLVAAITRHVDDVDDCDVQWTLWRCAVCGEDLDTQQKALEHCAVPCQQCGGKGYTERRVEIHEGGAAYIRVEQYPCPHCYQGFIPDPDEWAYHHPEKDDLESGAAP